MKNRDFARKLSLSFVPDRVARSSRAMTMGRHGHTSSSKPAGTIRHVDAQRFHPCTKRSHQVRMPFVVLVFRTVEDRRPRYECSISVGHGCRAKGCHEVAKRKVRGIAKV